MPIQFPGRVNYMDPAAAKRAVQQEEWNTLRQQGERDRQSMVSEQYDEGQRIDNMTWLAAASKLGMDMDPQMARRMWPSFVDEWSRRGFPEDKLPDPMSLSDEQFMSGFSRLHDEARMAIAGVEPEVDKSQPAKLQQAEWWLKATPEQRAGYMSANYAGTVKDIGGVPHWVMPGGDSVPLSTIGQEASGAAAIELEKSQAGEGLVRSGPGGPFEAAPGSKADIEARDRAREIFVGSRMKSVQAQTVVEDVARLSELIQQGKVPFGREADIQKELPDYLQSRGYRAAIALVKSVQGNVGVDQLINIKHSGAGLGQVPQAQLDLLSRLLGELDLGQGEEQFTFTWDRMGRVYQTIWDIADADMRELDMPPPDIFTFGKKKKDAPPGAVQMLMEQRDDPQAIYEFFQMFGYLPEELRQ